MAIAQPLHRSQRADELSASGLFGEGDQRIGRAAKRGHDDDRLTIETSLDDVGGAPDRLRVRDGSPAKLADDHGRSMRPVAAMSSAFSTEAPAAPRMMLCPSATSLTSSSVSRRTRPTVTVMPLPAWTS